MARYPKFMRDYMAAKNLGREAGASRSFAEAVEALPVQPDPMSDSPLMRELHFSQVVTTSVLMDASRMIRDRMDYQLERPMHEKGERVPRMAEQVRYATSASILRAVANDMESALEDYKPVPGRVFAGHSPQQARRMEIANIAGYTMAAFDEVAGICGDAVMAHLFSEEDPSRAFDRANGGQRAVDAGVVQARKMLLEVFDDLHNDTPCSSYDNSAAQRQEAVYVGVQVAQEMVLLNAPKRPDRRTLRGTFEHIYLRTTMNAVEKAFNLFAQGSPTEPPGQSHMLHMAGAVLTEMGIVQRNGGAVYRQAEHAWQENERRDKAESVASTQFREMKLAMIAITQSLADGELYEEVMDAYQQEAARRFPKVKNPPRHEDMYRATIDTVISMTGSIALQMDVLTRHYDGYIVDPDQPSNRTSPRMVAVPVSYTRN